MGNINPFQEPTQKEWSDLLEAVTVIVVVIILLAVWWFAYIGLDYMFISGPDECDKATFTSQDAKELQWKYERMVDAYNYQVWENGLIAEY